MLSGSLHCCYTNLHSIWQNPSTLCDGIHLSSLGHCQAVHPHGYYRRNCPQSQWEPVMRTVKQDPVYVQGKRKDLSWGCTAVHTTESIFSEGSTLYVLHVAHAASVVDATDVFKSGWQVGHNCESICLTMSYIKAYNHAVGFDVRWSGTSGTFLAFFCRSTEEKSG